MKEHPPGLSTGKASEVYMKHDNSRFIHWFDCGNHDLALIGGKNSSLCEMTAAGIRVPPGFAVTTLAYREFLDQTGLGADIMEMLGGLDMENVPAVQHASREIRRMMEETPVPSEIEESILNAYAELCEACGVADLPVAVRSSATAEDLPGASFAGQQDTILWVRSGEEVLKQTAQCWSSLFSTRAITYRERMNFAHENVYISVGIQKMANSKNAGVMFTLNPINGDRSKIAIDASWGLGESVASGEVTPDNFLVDKVTLEIRQRTPSTKLIQYTPNHVSGKVHNHPVPAELQNAICLSDEEILALSKLGKQIEKHYGSPQDIEWAIDHDLPFPENVMIVQSRPETVWSRKKSISISAGQQTGIAGIVDTLITGVRLKPENKEKAKSKTFN